MSDTRSVDVAHAQSATGHRRRSRPEADTHRPTAAGCPGQRWLLLAPSFVVFLPIGVAVASLLHRTEHDTCGSAPYPAWVGPVEAIIIVTPLIAFIVALAAGVRVRRRLRRHIDMGTLGSANGTASRIPVVSALWYARAAVFVSAVGLLAWPGYALLVDFQIHPLLECFGFV